MCSAAISLACQENTNFLQSQLEKQKQFHTTNLGKRGTGVARTAGGAGGGTLGAGRRAGRWRLRRLCAAAAGGQLPYVTRLAAALICAHAPAGRCACAADAYRTARDQYLQKVGSPRCVPCTALHPHSAPPRWAAAQPSATHAERMLCCTSHRVPLPRIFTLPLARTAPPQVEESVEFLKQNGLTGTARKAADEVLARVGRARELPGYLVHQVQEAWARLLALPPVRALSDRVQPLVDASLATYTSVHDLMVATPAYRSAFDTASALLARGESTWVWKSVGPYLQPTLNSGRHPPDCRWCCWRGTGCRGCVATIAV